MDAVLGTKDWVWSRDADQDTQPPRANQSPNGEVQGPWESREDNVPGPVQRGGPRLRKGVTWLGFSCVSWCQAPSWAMLSAQLGGRAGLAREAQVLLILAYLLPKSVSLFA